jgi:hypothetical protein
MTAARDLLPVLYDYLLGSHSHLLSAQARFAVYSNGDGFGDTRTGALLRGARGAR